GRAKKYCHPISTAIDSATANIKLFWSLGSFGDFIKTSGERRPGRAPRATPEAMAETRHKRKGTPGHAEPFLPSAVRGADRVSTGAPRLLLPRSAARARVTSSSNRAYGRSSAVRRATMT